MSGISDTHRGARIAWATALEKLRQPDLFGGAIPREMWRSIHDAADDQLNECAALRDARRVPSGDCSGDQAINAAPESVRVQ